jgi:hypothetical protein
MGFETAPKRGVAVHYGPRVAGGGKGESANPDGFKEYHYNYDGNAYPVNAILPDGAIVWNIIETKSTGAVSAATVGATDVILADGTEANAVATSGGALSLTGPTAGTVTVLVEERV